MVDIILALMPTTIIWNLEMPTAKRVGLSVLMAFGLLYIAPLHQ